MNLLNKSNIVNGNIIEDVDVYQIIDAFTYQVAYDLLISGSIAIGSGSTLPNVKLYIAGGNSANAKIEGGVSASSFTGSFLGNGAGITGVISSSYSVTASYANFAQNAGTASVANNISGAAGFIPVFTSPLTLGPSLMLQSGSSIILNNGSGPTPFTFDIGGSGRFTGNLVSSGSLTVSQSLNITFGNINLPTSSATYGVIYQNGIPVISFFNSGSGSGNIFIGSGSGNFTSSNSLQNIGIGQNALKSLTVGGFNTVLGGLAGAGLTSAVQNIFIGTSAGTLVSSGNSNILIGVNAGRFITTGIESTIVGTGAGANVTGDRNTFIGTGAGGVATTATNNIVITSNAGASVFGITIGQNNVILSPFNKNITSGNNNTILGHQAGLNTDRGSGNVFIGFQAGAGFNSSSFNTAIGFGAGALLSGSATGSVSGTLLTNVTIIANDSLSNLSLNLTSSNIFVYGINQNVLLGKAVDNGFKFQVSGTQHILATSGSAALVIAPASGFGGLTIGSDGNLSFGINQGYISRGGQTYIILPAAGGTLPGRLIPNDATHGWLFTNSINGATGVNDNAGVHIKDSEISFAAANIQPTVMRLQFNASVNGGLRRPYLNLISDDLQPNSNTGSTFLIKAGNSGLSSPNNLGNPGDLYLGSGNLASGSALFNVQGGNLFISGGYGSGTGSSGVINFYTATPLTASSSIPQTLNLLMSMSGSTVYTFGNANVNGGNLLINNTTFTDILTGSILNVAGTFNTSITGSPTLVTLGITDLTSSASSKFIDLKLNGVSKFSVSKDGNTGIAGNVTISGTSNFVNSWIGISNASAKISWNSDGSISFLTGVSTASLSMVLTNTGSLQVSGSVYAGHLAGFSQTPQVVTGSSAGDVATANITGSDLAGQVNLSSGTNITTSGSLLTVKFITAYLRAPFVVVTGTNLNTASGSVYITSTTGSFTINSISPISISTLYSWNYIVAQ